MPEQNCTTQPLHTQPVFSNWDVVAKGWYLVCPSRALKRKTARSYALCGQRITLFRGEDGQVRAVDAFCPHMGTDLGIGTVVDNTIQCFFHHWRFDGKGDCVDVPCGEKPPRRARLQSYGVDEKYGHIWVYPDADPPSGVADFKGLEGRDVHWVIGQTITHPCHHHVNMINGIDAQHLKTVHNIPMAMDLEMTPSEDGRTVDFTLSGPLPSRTRVQRGLSWLLGRHYAYSMRYVEGTVGMLSVMEQVKWLGRWPATPVRMLFAFTPLEHGKTRSVPIYIAEKKPGLRSHLKAVLSLWAMKLGYFVLRDDDAKVYDNIRFQPNALLKIDRPVGLFIAWVNRLPLSPWSNTHTPPPRQSVRHRSAR
jgi:phenylpropionate dioxygenase-like ring-hydroxylating dioxygenase large terminal subunit